MAVNLITDVGLHFRSLVKKVQTQCTAMQICGSHTSVALAPVGVAYGRRSRGA